MNRRTKNKKDAIMAIDGDNVASTPTDTTEATAGNTVSKKRKGGTTGAGSFPPSKKKAIATSPTEQSRRPATRSIGPHPMGAFTLVRRPTDDSINKPLATTLQRSKTEFKKGSEISPYS